MIKFYKMVEVEESTIKNGEPLIISHIPEIDEENNGIKKHCYVRDGNVIDYQTVSSLGSIKVLNLHNLTSKLNQREVIVKMYTKDIIEMVESSLKIAGFNAGSILYKIIMEKITLSCSLIDKLQEALTLSESYNKELKEGYEKIVKNLDNQIRLLEVI